MGYFEVFKFNNEKNNTLEIININNDMENKIYNLELVSNSDKYFYIKINPNDNNEYYLYYEIVNKYSYLTIDNNNEYYLYYEIVNIYSYLTIKKMPINIIAFSQNKTNNGIQLLNNKNEYIFKIGYLKPVYNLFKLFLVKNENKNLLKY